MRRGIAVALVLAGCLGAGLAQGQSDSSGQAKTKKNAAAQGQAPAATPPPADANPFPGDITNVPVMPKSLTPDVPAASPDEAVDKMAAPFDDLDPVKSPDTADGGTDIVQGRESSSDIKSMDSLLPTPGDDDAPTGKHKKKGDAIEGAPKETSKEDISVGQYYLDNKNWKAALSRFQSAMVLAPDEPEVYWGLAEANRHLGNFAEAKANYQKVVDYDPDSKHAKDAKKALKEPELANAAAAK
jgi:hypothetical protein